MADDTTIMTGNAPAFSLPDQNGHTVALSDFKGQWVVLLLLPQGRHARLHDGGLRSPPTGTNSKSSRHG